MNNTVINIIATAGDRIAQWLTGPRSFADSIAYRIALRNVLAESASHQRSPYEVFHGISDDLWFWLNTEGLRNNPSLRNILPGMPDEDVQVTFTGNKGDEVLREGFLAYTSFKKLYERHAGAIARCDRILDFGCGWGRIIRFFMKDVEPLKLWGCDPVQEMIDICRETNRWCSFEKISRRPPVTFPDNAFDLIYGYSVFSHLSEEMHEAWLIELSRILKPGGLLILTTRGRDFIEFCAEFRKRPDLDAVPAGPRTAASAFPDTNESLARYDDGDYCFTPLVHEGEWSYWGETAIPKQYVLKHWTRHLNFVDYLSDRSICHQNVIVMGKATPASSVTG